MRTSIVFLYCFCITYVIAQRRTASTEPTKLDTPRPQSRGRGRSRFVATADLSDVADELNISPEILNRRTPSRKRVPEITERKFARPTERPSKTSYEVEEVVNESPIETFLKKGRPNYSHSEPIQDTTIRNRPPSEPFLDTSIKPRILTESRFEIPRTKPTADTVFKPRILGEANTDPLPRQRVAIKSRTISENKFDTVHLPKRNIVQSNPSLNDIPDLSKLPDNAAPNVVFQEETITTPASDEVLETTSRPSVLDEFVNDQQPPEEVKTEITRTQPIQTTSRPTARRHSTAGTRRGAVRSRGAVLPEESTTVASRSRVRARPGIPKQTHDVAPARINRRQEQEVNVPLPSRVSLRPTKNKAEPIHFSDVAKKGPAVFGAVPYPVETSLRSGRRIDVRAPEKITIDLANPRSRETNSGRRKSLDPTHQPTFTSRGKAKSVPSFDESRLEVLPLFENEPKTVRPVASDRSRSRSRNVIRESRQSVPVTSRTIGGRRNSRSDDIIQTSATETDLQYRKPDNARVTVSVNVETRTESTIRRQQRKPQIKESVVAEVNEVTSKRVISRRKPSFAKTITTKPKSFVDKTVPRGNKKSEINLPLKQEKSSEEVDESDNYPPEFKAIIQAKKNKKVSRLSERLESAPRSSQEVTNFVTSSTAPNKAAVADQEKVELDNELIHTSTTAKIPTRPSRTRSSLITRLPETTASSSIRRKPTLPPRKNNKVLRSTALPEATTPISKETKTYPRFNEKKGTIVGKLNRSSSRTSYTRKLKQDDKPILTRERLSVIDEPILLSTKIPKTPSFSKKPNRNQSKYRSGISSRGPVVRSTTNAPAYIPTIPSAPYVPTIPTVTPPSRAKENVWAEDVVDYNWSFTKLY